VSTDGDIKKKNKGFRRNIRGEGTENILGEKAQSYGRGSGERGGGEAKQGNPDKSY